MHGALNLLLLQGPEENVGKFPPGQLSFDEGEQPQVTWSQVTTVGGHGSEAGCFLLLLEGHSDFGFVTLAQLWNPFFFSGTTNGITCLITLTTRLLRSVQFLHGNKVRYKVSPDTSFNYVAI